LMLNLYRHPQVLEQTGRARQVVTELYLIYHEAPDELPAMAAGATPLSLRRRVADHIAGMTDRYALREHQRLTGQSLFEA
ncbi:MAG: deoxyguanosinetriphosphate triphosphohydrolase, partial [Serpentinimonas sp.]|nr:deoxyguanosinetriphosphate triphosphohydrolase [Serpentinimonas sp.]